MSQRTIEVALRANIAQFQAQMGAAANQVRAFGADISKTLATTNREQQRAMETVAHGALLFGGALVGGVGLAVRATANFEKALDEVRAVTGATETQMNALSESALDMGQKTVFSASEAAAAQGELAKAGVGVSDILGGALQGSLALAAAGELDVASAATIAAQAMNIFNLNGSDVGRVADVLAAGANKSATNVDMLGESFSQGALVAAQTGLSLEETVAALSAFAEGALVGSDAGTSLKTMLQRLTPQSAEARTLMDQLGFSAYDAQGNFIGLEALAGELQSSLGGLSVEQRNAAMTTLFGSDAIRGANILYEQGAAGIRDYVEAVDDQGAAAELARQKMDNLSGDLERLKGSIETTLIRSGASANTILREMVQATEGVINVIGGMHPGVLAAGGALTGLGGSAVLVVGGLGTLIPKIHEGRQALLKIGGQGSMTSKAMGKLNSSLGFLGKAGLWGAGILVLGGAIEALTNYVDRLIRGAQDLPTVSKALLDLAQGKGAVDALGEAARGNQDDLRKFLDMAADPKYAQGGRSGLKRALEDIDAGLRGMVEGGLPDAAAEALRRFAEAHDVRVSDIFPYLTQYSTALEEAGVSTRFSAAAAEEAKKRQGGFTDSMTESEAAAAEMDKTLSQLAQSYKDTVGNQLAAMSAGIGYRDSVRALAEQIEATRKAEEQAALATEGRAEAQIAAQRALDKALADQSTELGGSEFGAMADARRSVAQADEALTKAKEASLAASENVTQAYKDEAKALDDLRDAKERNAVDEEKIGLDLEQARSDVGKAKSTRERELALNKVKDLELDLAEAQEKRTEDAQALADAEARGVGGSDMVIDALQRQADTAQGVIDAEFRQRQAYHETERVAAETSQGVIDARANMAEVNRQISSDVVAQQDALEQAFIDVVTSANEAYEAMVGNGEKVGTAEERNRFLRDRIREVNAELGINLPGAVAIANEALSRLPAQVTTNVHTNYTSSSSAGTAVGTGLGAGAPRFGTGPAIAGLATGGQFKPGWWLVGEEGPELVHMNGSGFVYTTDDPMTRMAMEGGALTPMDWRSGPARPLDDLAQPRGWANLPWMDGAPAGAVADADRRVAAATGASAALIPIPSGAGSAGPSLDGLEEKVARAVAKEVGRLVQRNEISINAEMNADPEDIARVLSWALR
ncbi:MAG TPA: phage tail tape measure protein [Acidimicrobiales bacterium]|nr:phage tail tape measure protein [Acidimicrobiales bacterium]